MPKLIFFIFAFCSATHVIAQKKDPQNIVIPTYEQCKEKWNYIFVKDTLCGTILYYENPPFACGKLSSASITIIKTTKGDSLRILQVCDTTTSLFIKQKIWVIPDYTAYRNIALPFNTSKSDCEVKNTLYGIIKIRKPG